METVRIADIDGWIGPADVKKPISRAVRAERIALNYYELDPGDSLGFGYHRHEAQEELFYVRRGTVTFETEAGDVTVGADEIVRFAPGEWQRGTNDGSERANVLAIGAPQDGGETTILRDCRECGNRTAQEIERPTDDADALVTVCVICGTETGRFT